MEWAFFHFKNNTSTLPMLFFKVEGGNKLIIFFRNTIGLFHLI